MARSYTPRFPHPRFTKRGDKRDFTTRISSKLAKVGHPLANARRRAGLHKFNVSELDDLLYQWALDTGSDFLKSTYDVHRDRGEDFISYDLLAKMTEQAAIFVLAENSQERFILSQKARGAAGGRKSKRPPKYPHSLLEQFEPDAKAEDIAKELGVHKRTVENMRRRARAALSAPPSKPTRKPKTKEQKARDRARALVREGFGSGPTRVSAARHREMIRETHEKCCGAGTLAEAQACVQRRDAQPMIVSTGPDHHDLLPDTPGLRTPPHDKPVRLPEPSFVDILNEPESETADYMTRFVALANDVSPTYRPADILAGVEL